MERSSKKDFCRIQLYNVRQIRCLALSAEHSAAPNAAEPVSRDTPVSFRPPSPCACSRLPERKEYALFSKEKDTPFSEAGQTAVIFLAAGVDNRYRMDYIYLNLKIINLKINKKAIGGEQG
ncbi:hypothetical protein PGRAT_30840 [Paenibacillus graminis]|uniref:Uncharacterized protein n=1 Tax=Paenibacillus graminis TaxID=189425 RepID=A0A089NQY8_9BACL|nr:hypothetical protein PGRAT_30840 [Paenibacillus graminis]